MNMTTCHRIGLASVLLSALAARADETRTFRVWHDGRRVGSAEMQMTVRDGLTEFATTIRVDERTAVARYRYTFSGRETWRDGRAVEFHSSAAEDGATFHLAFDARSGELTTNGRSRRIRGPVWPTTFAQATTPGPITLVDADSGRLSEGRLDLVGSEIVRVIGKDVATTRYHVTGQRDVTLWYDAGGGLVRQSWVVIGAEMVLELSDDRSK